MENETYLFLAFLITWAVFAAYLWSLNKQTQSLNEEVKTIRGDDDERDV